jgi:hypothetical protein
MRTGYGRNTRDLLTTMAKPLMVLDFGDLPVFEEATTYPAIIMVEKAPPPAPSATRRGRKSSPPDSGGSRGGHFFAATFTDPEQLTRFADILPATGFVMPVSTLKAEGWTLERPEVHALVEKLRKSGMPLGEYVGGKIYYGIKTGLNEAFVIDEETRQRLIDEDPKSGEIIKPWLRGKDIRKWRATWRKVYVIAIVSSANRLWPWSNAETESAALKLFELSYPAIYKHLIGFTNGLKKREDQGKYFWELRSCAYYSQFEKPKIIWPGITADVAVFSYDDEGYYGNDNNQLIVSDDLLLVAVLNSSLTRYVLQQICDKVRGGFYRLKIIYIEQLPIPTATNEQRAYIIALVDQILAVKKAGPQVDTGPLERQIDTLVYELYGLTEEEIALVEGVK